MKRYLTQLLADLESVARQAPAVGAYQSRPRSFDDDEQNDLSVYYSRNLRLCDLFGLEPHVFPPQEKLTREQLAPLLSAIEHLWAAWNVSWECPPGLKARRRYEVMVRTMQGETIYYHPDFGARVDFCDKRAEGICPFGEQDGCWCRSIDQQTLPEPGEFPQNQESTSNRPGPVEDYLAWIAPVEENDGYWTEQSEIKQWARFAAEEDLLSWLYFYHPARQADVSGEELPADPEDFEDFDWYSASDDPELPF